ncbi:hypothetical protein [Paenibacillus contaminans]|uniref:Uncharacterized protein n=1 Tax=Paenibacillus contaminans TaxID=450362 RepID=A0A329MGP8_9BACL|nr:hypothetical protein [Paenibacillus contaminans]RAV18862.1 hypothetical protein DQG23_24345 [Paenibacillus contaminans]
MDLVRLNKDLRNKSRVYQKGLVFLAIKTDHGQYIACDRKCGFAGEVFHAEHCEIVPEWQGLDQELIKLREEVASLTEERSLLLQQIERTIDEQKLVELPREVAEIIDGFHRDCEIGRISKHQAYLLLLSVNEENDHPIWKSIRKFATERPFDYMSAIVNGYTVEQPAEVKLINGLLTVIEKWFSIPSHEINPGEDERELAEMIAKYVKGIYADQTT